MYIVNVVHKFSYGVLPNTTIVIASRIFVYLYMIFLAYRNCERLGDAFWFYGALSAVKHAPINFKS